MAGLAVRGRGNDGDDKGNRCLEGTGVVACATGDDKRLSLACITAGANASVSMSVGAGLVTIRGRNR